MCFSGTEVCRVMCFSGTEVCRVMCFSGTEVCRVMCFSVPRRLEARQGHNEAEREGKQGLLPEERIDTARGAWLTGVSAGTVPGTGTGAGMTDAGTFVLSSDMKSLMMKVIVIHFICTILLFVIIC